MNKHTMSDLYSMQAAPLSVKIKMTARRIRDWVILYGILTKELFTRLSGIKRICAGMLKMQTVTNLSLKNAMEAQLKLMVTDLTIQSY